MRVERKETTSGQAKEAGQRLKLAEASSPSAAAAMDMILEVIPVIPARSRPLVAAATAAAFAT